MRIAEIEATVILGCSLKETSEACCNGCLWWWQGTSIWTLNMQEGEQGLDPQRVKLSMKVGATKKPASVGRCQALAGREKFSPENSTSYKGCHMQTQTTCRVMRWPQIRNSPWGICLSFPLSIHSQPLSLVCLS